ncbi:MAG TPA: sigma-70 family RNA polymerase sigma factor [Gemmataceae bacterium]|jgi:RNA polymerase sigma-70 factor (ECF subfamily)|nr:sigma-70 family RNA polymerase sigma factor [Gemmataceae bacterium]
MAVFLAQWASWARRSNGAQNLPVPTFQGTANTLAASLDMAISKNTRWLTDIFGCDADGQSLFRHCVRRSNAGQKRKGHPVEFALECTTIPPENIRVFVAGNEVDRAAEFDPLIRYLTTRAVEPEAHEPKVVSTPESSAPLAVQNTGQVVLTIDRDLDSFGDEDTERVLTAVGELLKTKFVRTVTITRGSVKLILEVPGDKTGDLVNAINQGALDRLDVVTADELNSDGLSSAVLINQFAGISEQGERGPTAIQSSDSVARAIPARTHDHVQPILNRLANLAKKMVGHFPGQRTDVDDILQLAMIRLLNSLKDVRPESTRSFYNFAAVQMRRELLDMIRTVKRRPPTDNAIHAGDGPGLQGIPASSDPNLDRWAALHLAVEQLPVDEREVVGLTFYHGWSQMDIAVLLQVSDRHVRRIWSNAIRHLSAALGGQLPEI